MSLINLIKSLLNLQKKLDKKILPSQGLFYKDDFEIWIKKANVGDIIEYEHDYVKDDVGVVITKLKKIVENNTILSSGYTYNDIKSIDVVFVFLEIVKLTKGKSINLNYFDDEKGKESIIEFDSSHFNYFKIDNNVMEKYDNKSKQFEIDGFKYSLPSIGVENCLTNYLISKSYDSDAIKYNSYNYDFTYFLGEKNIISFDEIDNLIQIFNFDMESSELKKVRTIVKSFSPIQKYSLKRGNRVIEINSKIDLEKIWK
ncbi:MAG TPA: hypothetical protein PLC25_04085 [Bacilli bacterium]|nr:hypothetical protein [Bacilli bacterium]